MSPKFEKAMVTMSDKVSNNIVLLAIRNGFLVSTPLLIVGSIFLLIANFPIPGWEDWMTSIFGANWGNWFTNVSRATYKLTGLLTCIGVGYAFAEQLKVDKIQGAALSVVSMIILTDTSISTIPGVSLADGSDAANNGIDGLAFRYVGPDGIFMGLICALVAVLIFAHVYKRGWTIKLPAGVPKAVSDSFAALIPSAVVMLIFFFIRIIFDLTPFGTVQNAILTLLQAPLRNLGDTLGANILYLFACQFLWFFGINGPSVVNSVYFFTTVITIEQLEAFQAGQPLPHIFTDPFSNFFCNWGGAGSTLAMVALMIFVCKSKRLKELGKLSIVPGIFGINEPIIFGMPMVLNPVMAVPFIGVPIVNLVLSYVATLIGFLPRTTGVSLPWTTPIGFSGWLSTGSFIAVVWQLALLVLNGLIYLPFLKVLDAQYVKEEHADKSSKTMTSEQQSTIAIDNVDDINLDFVEF